MTKGETAELVLRIRETYGGDHFRDVRQLAEIAETAKQELEIAEDKAAHLSIDLADQFARANEAEASLASARREALEEAMKSLCGGCDAGWPARDTGLIETSGLAHWEHIPADGGKPMRCYAVAIRVLSSPRQEDTPT